MYNIWIFINSIRGRTFARNYSTWGHTTEWLHFHFYALEREMATHSSVLAWRIPGTGEPGGLLSMGSHRVGHDWSDLAAAAAAWQGEVTCERSLGQKDINNLTFLVGLTPPWVTLQYVWRFHFKQFSILCRNSGTLKCSQVTRILWQAHIFHALSRL